MRTISFPALTGKQGNHPCYSIMIPCRTYLRLTAPPDADVSPDQRAQRDLSEASASKLAQYLLANPETRVMSGVTLLARDATFTDGCLVVPDSPSAFAVADGQHRRRAIELAAETDPAILDDFLPALVFAAEDIDRARFVFVSINSGRPVPSTIRIYYQPGEHRAVLEAARRAPFLGLVEFTAPNPARTSGKLWSLSAMTRTRNICDEAWWSAVIPALPGFSDLASLRTTARDLRDTYVWAHGVGLEALGHLNARGVTPDQLATLPASFWRRDAVHWLNICTDGRRMLANSRSGSGMANVIQEVLC